MYIPFYILSLFQFIRTAMLDNLSDLLFAVFDLSARAANKRKDEYHFHFSYSIELIIPRGW